MNYTAAELDDPFALFKADLESQNIELMIDACNKLTVVAAALGKQRTVQELLPYLPKIMSIPSDEVLSSIGRQLFNIYDLAGGASELPEDLIKIIFSCLRQLGEEEEVLVRQSAVICFQKLVPTLPHNIVFSHLLPLYRHFAIIDLFGARHTAASIAYLVYEALQPQFREDVRQSFVALAQDETPMVRRVVAMTIPKFCAVITKLAQQMIASTQNIDYTQVQNCYELIKITVVPVVQQLSIDERDYLRDLAPQAVAGIIPHLTLQDSVTYLVPILRGLADDLSWKVRQRLIQQLPTVIVNFIQRAVYQISTEIPHVQYPNDIEAQKAALKKVYSETAESEFDINTILTTMFNLFKAFLADSNPEVRSIAILVLPDIIFLTKGCIQDDFFTAQPRQPVYTAECTAHDHLSLELQYQPQTLPHITEPVYNAPKPVTDLFPIDHVAVREDLGATFHDIIRDLSPLSKVDISESFALIAPFVPFDFVDRYIIPTITTLAQDDHVQVRCNVILALEPILQACPQNTIILSIWPIFEALHLDLRWRVRRAIATQLSTLSRLLKSNRAFIENSLVPHIQTLLSENVHAVRNRTAVEFRSIVYILGIDDVIKFFLPQIVELFDVKQNYLHRITALHFIYFSTTAYGNACPISVFQQSFTQFLTEAIADQVPNVRILATKYIVELMKRGFIDRALADQFKPQFENMAQDPIDREIQLQGRLAVEYMESVAK